MSEELDHFIRLLQSLGIGLLIGLERERREEARAGVRTFALIALSGALTAFLAAKFGSVWIMAAALLVLGGGLTAAHMRGTNVTDPGTTSIAAAVVTFALGAMTWADHAPLAVSVAILTTALLYFRAELHGAVARLSRQDIVSLLQVSVLAFVVLPLLPDRGFGPYAVLNPYRIGLLAALISSLSFVGYLALRLLPAGNGVLLLGIAGGLASTTATTLAFSRYARRDAHLTSTAQLVILLANLVLFIRVGVLAALVAPAVLAALVPPLAAGLAVGGAYVAWCWRQHGHQGAPPELDIRSPADLRTALGFAALFAVVQLSAAWLNDKAGAAGLGFVAFAAGLTDLDAITLSSLRMANAAQISIERAGTAILIAYMANLAFKLSTVGVLGTRPVLRHVGTGFALGAAAMLGAWLWVAGR